MFTSLLDLYRTSFTETRQTDHWKIMLYQGGGEKIHTLEIGGHVQKAKSDLEAQRNSLREKLALVMGVDRLL
jgi:trans-2-enoyl-CoA reductase